MSLTGGDIIYYLLKPPVKCILKWKFNIQVESNALKDTNEPFLLLGHHVSNEDPVISNAYSNRLIRYIAGDANQDHWLKRNLLAMLESIPFAKNRADTKSIRIMMKHVKDGHPIGLYPEGGRNWDGTTDTLIPSTAKLIKMLKIPVYAAFFKGGYLTRPRWASFPRRGKLVIEIKQLFDKDTVAEKTAEELYILLVDKLSYNEFVWQAENRVPFKGKNLAEHIERLLYICPACKSVNTLKSHGDKFHCSICKAEYTFNKYGEIHGCPDFSETASWNKWQRSQLPHIIQKGFSFSNPNMSLEKRNVVTKKRQKHQVQLTLFPDKLELQSSSKQSKGSPPENTLEVIDIPDMSSLSITFMDVVEFYAGKTKYRLVFEPQRHMSVKLFYDLLMAIKA